MYLQTLIMKKSPICIRDYIRLWKGLPILIQLPRKKEFDDKKENHPEGGFPKIKLV